MSTMPTDIPTSSGPGLTCPKCHGAMRTYERSGVHVDQCADCRGIFFDRGELERLVDAESSFYSNGGTDRSDPQGYEVRGYGHYGDGYDSGGHYRERDRDDDYHTGRYGGSYRKRKKGGFLGELFDE